MFDKIPVQYKSKAAPLHSHAMLFFVSRYAFRQQPCIIKHNCHFHAVFIKLFVTFLTERLFITFNCELSIIFATLSVIIVTQQPSLM